MSTIKKILSQNTKLSSKNITALFLAFIILLLTIQSSAQSDTTKSKCQYIKSYWTDTKAIFKAPTQWKGKQWLTFAGLSGGLALTIVYDQEIYDFIGRQISPQSENISKYIIEPWGRGIYTLPLLGAIYLSGKKNSRHRQIAITGLKAFIISGAFSQVAKHIFHRHRPSDNDPPDPSKWDGPFPFQMGHTSFPSGHATAAFSVASVLAYGYRDKIWVGISAYTMATLVGISRIHDQKHWSSDVFGGAVLGTFIGITLSKLNFKNVELFPTTSMNSYGVGMVYHIR